MRSRWSTHRIYDDINGCSIQHLSIEGRNLVPPVWKRRGSTWQWTRNQRQMLWASSAGFSCFAVLLPSNKPMHLSVEKTGSFSLHRAGFLCTVPFLFLKELHCHKNRAAFTVCFVPTFSIEACLLCCFRVKTPALIPALCSCSTVGTGARPPPDVVPALSGT